MPTTLTELEALGALEVRMSIPDAAADAVPKVQLLYDVTGRMKTRHGGSIQTRRALGKVSVVQRMEVPSSQSVAGRLEASLAGDRGNAASEA